MNRNSKILLGVMLLLVVLSVAATFYKTVVLQDFEVTGVHIVFPTKNSSTVWFVYNNEEHELELETVNYNEIVVSVAEELGMAEAELDVDFLEQLAAAYDEGAVLVTKEEKGGDKEYYGDNSAAESTIEIPEEFRDENELTATEELIDVEQVIETEI